MDDERLTREMDLFYDENDDSHTIDFERFME